MLRGGLVGVLAVALLSPPSAQQPRSTFRTGTDLVHFGVTVTDRRGTVVSGLTADDFQIVENGVPQTIAHFAQGADDTAPQLHVGLMLDTSVSMVPDAAAARTAAIKFLNRFPDAEDLTLVDFSTEVRVGRFSQDDFPRLVERIRTREMKGWTALYDAFIVYLHGAAADEGRTVMLAFTDGGDSRSSARFRDVVDSVRASDVTIYAIGFLEHQSASVRNEQRRRLSLIAEESGGLAIYPRSTAEIDTAFDRIVAEIHGQYSLGYVSTDARRDGRWRPVRIRLRPDLRDLRVRTRAGYFAPLDMDP